MKRRDLLKRLQEIAKAEGRLLEVAEGGRHTKVVIGSRASYIPRHGEVNEHTARAILGQMDPRNEGKGK